MSDAIITVILTQLATIMEQQIRKEIRLVSGVEKQVKKLTNSLQSIKAVLVDAEKKQVNDHSIKLWLENLKDVSYDTEDVLSEWLTSMLKAEIQGLHHDEHQSNPIYRKVCSFVNLPFLGLNKYVLRRDIALKIKEINGRLDVIAIEKDRYKLDGLTGCECLDRVRTVSFVDVLEVQGRNVDKDVLLRKMLMLSKEGHRKGLNVVSIVGMGGIGKTTLAQAVYSSDAVDQHFDRKMWVCVSDPFDEVRIAKAILEDIEGSAPCLFELETAVRKIREYVVGRKFLLVLDDVWDEDFRKWEQLFNSLGTGRAGSTVLVTTRNECVAKAMGSTYELRLEKLSEQESWALFSKIAFFERKNEERVELEGIGKRIAEKCNGLPLTIKTIASLMRFKKTPKDWQDVLSNEFWGFEVKAKGLFPPLMLSYYDLPSDLKRCFSFCAFFPKDHLIEAVNLVKLWMAQGYMEVEEIGQEYLQNLAMRSFFQVMEKTKDGKNILSVKMHDMVHDLAQYLTKNEFSIIEVHEDLEQKIELLDKRVRHLTLIRAEDTRFPTIPNNVEKLFTFWVQSFYDSPPIISQFDKIEPEFFCHVARVRALNLSRNLIGELPKEIEKLTKLKYLNLSHNPFYELPSTLCDLYNLQTLNLSCCNHLRILPQSIGKLINLRHLEIDGTDRLKALPKGISNMSSLHTLSKFIITRGDAETCGLKDLNNLNNLRGCLKIEGLGFVTDADMAKKANLVKKIQISDLHLDFSSFVHNNKQDEVIEALELHENVQVLQISEFGGTKLPTWIAKLTNVETLSLQNCQNCTNLPPLGKLPSLVTLNLDGMNKVKFFGLEFSGNNTSFPRLKKLKISNMEGLEEWELIWQNEEIPIKIMPRLMYLKISQCSKLKALPSFILHKAPVKKLRVYKCTLLQQLYNKETGEDWSKISHIKNVRIS